VLSAEKILAVRERRGEGELHGVGPPGAPALVGGRASDRTGLPTTGYVSLNFSKQGAKTHTP
jgi:hypothetical protein